MSSNSVCNHTRDKQIGLPLRGRPILLSLVWLQTELDSTQSYYHYISCSTSSNNCLKFCTLWLNFVSQRSHRRPPVYSWKLSFRLIFQWLDFLMALYCWNRCWTRKLICAFYIRLPWLKCDASVWDDANWEMSSNGLGVDGTKALCTMAIRCTLKCWFN